MYSIVEYLEGVKIVMSIMFKLIIVGCIIAMIVLIALAITQWQVAKILAKRKKK